MQHIRLLQLDGCPRQCISKIIDLCVMPALEHDPVFSICKAFCRVSDLSDRSSDPAGKIEGDTAGQQQGYEGNINQLVGQDLDRGRHRPKRRKGIDDQRCFIFRDQYIAICQDVF